MDKRVYILIGEVAPGSFEELTFNSYDEAIASIGKKPYIYTAVVERITSDNSTEFNPDVDVVPQADHSYYTN